MQDGQNLFDPGPRSSGNYWSHGENRGCADRGRAIEPLIIVGIYNGGIKRINEYTPVEASVWAGDRRMADGRMLVES